MLFRVFAFLLLFSSCQDKNTDSKKKSPIIIFSHNLHGELETCGCRKKPLGGMIQAAGFIEKTKEKYPDQEIIYFDTGDSLYPPGNIPNDFIDSHNFAAEGVVKYFKDMNLKAYIPGDQDFSQGFAHFLKLTKKHQLPVLWTNAMEPYGDHIKGHITYELDNLVIYFLGVLDKKILHYSLRHIVQDAQASISKKIRELEKSHGEKYPAKQKMIILLSHSGLDRDKVYAQENKNLSWIIGAHSQSFTQLPEIVNQTKIVQVLSRNHHMGLIDLSKPQKSFETVELNDLFSEFDGKNIWQTKYDKYRQELKEIKEKEFDKIGTE